MRTLSRSTVPSIKVASSVLSGGASFSGRTRYLAITTPSRPMSEVATSTTAAICSQGEVMPMATSPSQVASPANAPTVSTSPWLNLITSSTPKNSVKPTATRAYIMPSISPLTTNWPSRPRSMVGRSFSFAGAQARGDRALSRRIGRAGCLGRDARALFEPRELALAARVLAVLPDHPLAALDGVLGGDRHGVRAVVGEGDRADDGVVVLDLGQLLDDRLAIRSDLLNGVEEQVHGGECERTIGLGRLAVTGLLVLLHEKLTARQLLDRCALEERQRALGERAEAVDEGVGDDAGRALELRIDPEPVHLLSDAHAERRQAAEVDHVGIQRLGLGEFGGEVLLVGSDAEGRQDLAAARGDVLGEVLVVALAVVGGVVDHHPGLVAQAGHQLGRGLVLIDHGAVDPVDLRVVVAIGDLRQDRTPDDDRQAETVVGVDRGDRHRRTVVGHARDHPAVGARLGRNLHGD